MKLLNVICLTFCSVFCFSQSVFDKLEFNHFNTIILGSNTKVTFERIKNNNCKVRAKIETKARVYTKRIRKEKYLQICNAIQKINKDSLFEKHLNIIDGANTNILAFTNTDETDFFISGLSKKDENSPNSSKRNFWLASKLILESVKLSLHSLADY